MKSGSGRGTEEDTSPSRNGGRLGGKASASRQPLNVQVQPRRLLKLANAVRRKGGSNADMRNLWQ